jgi:hypothetical protein
MVGNKGGKSGAQLRARGGCCRGKTSTMFALRCTRGGGAGGLAAVVRALSGQKTPEIPKHKRLVRKADRQAIDHHVSDHACLFVFVFAS